MKQSKAEIKAKHIANLANLFGLSVDFTNDLYKYLKSIEKDGHKQAERYCNGEVDSIQIDEIEAKLKSNLLATLKYAKSDVVRNLQFNWDPRGHFLKLNDEYVRTNRIQIETDWGGYGIICPEEI